MTKRPPNAKMMENPRLSSRLNPGWSVVTDNMRLKRNKASRPRGPRARHWVAVVLLAAASLRADSYWQGGTSDFNVAGSWSPTGVPTGVNAFNDSGSNNVVLVQRGDPVWSPWDIRAGDGANASGAYLQTGSTNTVNGWFRLGDSASAVGYYTLSNGMVNALLQAHVGEVGDGVLTVAGGAFNVGQNPFCVGDGDFGAGGTGTFYMRGGTVTTAVGVDLWLGEGYNGGDGGTGTMMMSGGVVNIGGWLAIGRFGGIGDLELSGGSLTMAANTTGEITLATTPSTGVIHQTGGALTNTASETWVAESAVGTWTLSGGVDMLGLVRLTRLSDATGTFNLNGGDLYATQILDTGGNGAFNFNGGILHARAGFPSFLQAGRGITVQVGGAVIDSAGFNIGIPEALTNGSGGLTKLGAGTLTLSSQLYYTGPTIVSNGTLVVPVPNAFASSGGKVSSGGVFGLALTADHAQLVMPAFTVAASGGGLNFNFGGSGGQTNAPLSLTVLDANGPVTIGIAGYNFSPGEYPLIQYSTHIGSGGFTLGSVPAGMTAQIVTNTANKSIDLVVTAAAAGLPWQPLVAPLMTEWAQQVNATNVLPEYPRPQMVRSNWQNLNGVWEFQAGATNDPVPVGQNLAGTILVPFPMESALSGIGQYAPFSWYRHQFSVPAGWSGQRILLHFGAVNWRSQIFVNGQSVGTHTGGYDPFTYDITPYLTNSGLQELIVRVYSPEDSGSQPRGKQTLYPAGIMFRSSSGIWQSVWLEPVPATSINGLHLVPDVDHQRLWIDAGVSSATIGLTVSAVAFAGSNQVATATGTPGANFYLNIPSPTLWSPTNPYLYDLRISLLTNASALDSVDSYFGMRKISLGTNNGVPKMFLNNQFVFEFGPLDQGFWPDGIYTAPTDLALKSDLEMEKALGFNMVRKHIKVEPQRWYYWADQLGLLVWQDMPSCNSYTTNPDPPTVDPVDFVAELTAMVTNHWNSPSIIMWDVFNEAQGEAGDSTGNGQTNTPYLVSLVKSLDSSRLVDQASGWTYYGVGDLMDTHHYPDPECSTSTNQAVACGEYGGVWLGVIGHTWSPAASDVFSTQAVSTVTTQFEALTAELPNLIQNRGMSAAVYTEISDVEIELGGLRTFDRKVLKPSLAAMQTNITALTARTIFSTTPTWNENGTGLAAQYFSDTNLTTTVFTCVDTNIDFNWAGLSPGAGLSNGLFSVRWTGKIQPRYSEGYTFHLTTADGCRLWVNGQLLIDNWRHDTNSDLTGSLALTGGQQCSLEVDYYNASNNAAGAVFEWDSASQARQVVPMGVLYPANRPPVLAPVANATITAGQTLLLTNTATDADVPAQTLTFSLAASPTGATINTTNGLITWRPAIAQAPFTNRFTVVVTDSGTPAMSATQSFTVTVLLPATPVFSSPTNAAGQFQSLIDGSVGPDYLIYATTNLLADWRLLEWTNPVTLPFVFVDPIVVNSSQRYYRVLLGP
jgi:autotransporter-associated beta strand protein